jgi:hypothetical protein
MHLTALLLGLALAGPADAPECRNPPARTSDAYWPFIEACGCASLEAPSRASSDYDRYLKACSGWRERNPSLTIVVPQPSPSSSPAPAAEPSVPSECRNPPSRVSDAYWSFIDACGCAQLDPLSSASPDHDRFLTACSGWRARHPRIEIVVPTPTSTPAPR